MLREADARIVVNSLGRREQNHGCFRAGFQLGEPDQFLADAPPLV
jgi:hypothetical protein